MEKRDLIFKMLSISSFGNIMDELFGGIDGKLRTISITDSTMMRIVHGAMNRAHERVKSKEGATERLNEISKFYELAVMQLQGCVEFVQDESSHEEEVLAGLMEIRDRLKGRLGETERAMAEKDRELVERAESETRLRQALETKERELSSLKAKLERTRNINEGVDGRDGEFCELKNSVDQQVWNIRQRLEPDYDDDRGGEIGDEKVEQMGTDIDALKETLDVAFKKMRSAIFSSEAAPVEQQWRWGVEKDTFFVLIRGLASDFRDKFEGKERGSGERKFPVGFDEFWHGFEGEIEGLKRELGSFLGRLEEIVQERRGGSSRVKPIVEEVENGENENYVTKMIKNHESIIREKCAEAERLSLLRQEVMREKALPSSRIENEPVCLVKRAQDLMVKLDGLIEWNDKLSDYSSDHSHANGGEIVFDTSVEARESMNKVSCSVIEEVPNKISKLEQELQDSNLETMIIEETYVVVFEGMKNQWDEDVGNINVESQIREEIYFLVLSEAFKAFGSSNGLGVTELNRTRDENYGLEFSEFNEKLDDIETLVCRETSNDWSESMEIMNTDILVSEEICRIVFDEAFKSIVETAGFALRRCEEAKIAGDQGKKLQTRRQLGTQESSVQSKDHLLKWHEPEEHLIQSTSFELERKENVNPSGAVLADSLAVHDQERPTICLEQDRETSTLQLDKSVHGFFQMMADFELMVEEKLELNSLRLEEIYKQSLNPIVNIVSSLREQESLYRKAFIRRCQNLHKAEIEVDLLGDQVELLLSVLQNIYTSLRNCSPNLQQNVWVSELLHMIKTELKGVIHTSNLQI